VFKGIFDQWTAEIAFDPKDLANSRISIVISTASARTWDRPQEMTLSTPNGLTIKSSRAPHM
jgi:polyisoprenoid-binding protein YceI